jgi:hypothetical protein
MIEDIEKILKNEYSRENFINLIDKILSDFKHEKKIEKYKNKLFVAAVQLGKSKNCELSVFEVVLTDNSINKRVSITEQMFKILDYLSIKNAIVSFVDKDKKKYRISLLTKEYKIDNNDKVIQVKSNPSRYSYSLGVGAKTKTPYECLFKKDKVNGIEELISRFSKNVVNKKFYLKIAQCFNELVNDQIFNPDCLQGIKEIAQKNKREEFVVRLIGRIIFCKFLCEKYSKQGKPLLSPDIFSKESIYKYKNYYHEKLELLFFELLNTEQKQRKNYFFDNQYYKIIPYLNGGLFSPHEYDFYYYDENKHCGKFGFVTISNNWFENFFNILDEYNFTVDEDSPYDIELSIDPEMLGRIFENLLNKIHTENGKNAKNKFVSNK